MGERRILIIGSQCAQMPPPPLSFLPQLAHDLYEVMTDPELGGCVPSLKAAGPMIDPSVADARAAIESAFRQASKDEATLFLAFIGHGEIAGADFYLLPHDASLPPKSHTAIHLVQLITELHREHSFVDGLVVLLDCCYSGLAAAGASAQWVGVLGGTLRFEVLTAAADRPAADGCFTRNLVDVIRNGLDDSPLATLRCEQVRKILQKRCRLQVPQMPAYNADEGLYLAKNVAWLAGKKRWEGVAATEVERLTEWFQPTPELAAIVEAATDARCVMLTGVAGAGKSALAAALARPEVTGGLVPAGFVKAVAFVTSASSSKELASQLAEQLKGTVPAFVQAQQRFCEETPEEEWKQLDAWRHEILGPLRFLSPDHPVRIVIDGLDQLSASTNFMVYQALGVLATDPALAAVQLLVTARPDTTPPSQSKTVLLDRTDDDTIRRYLEQRQIPSNAHQAIVSRAQGSWLVSRLLADQVSANSDTNPQDLPPNLVGIYDLALCQAGASESQRWRAELRPVLGVLAAAGVGPILPMPLLCAASSKLGGPVRPTCIRDILVDLRGLVVRGSPGTENEHVGVFHQTFTEYLLDPTFAFGIDASDLHRALAEAILELAPMDKHDPNNALHRYAAAREFDHLLEIGRYPEAAKAVYSRASIIPAENLARHQSLYVRIAVKLDEDHPDMLVTRYNIANLTAQAGDLQEPLLLYKKLLPDRERVQGKGHLGTLKTRHDIATLTGKAGNAQEALRLLTELLPDCESYLGKDHPDTLFTRQSIAAATSETGNAQEALELLTELLPDQESVLRKDHPHRLLTRQSIAYLTGETGNAQKALELFTELLPDRESVLGKDHPDTLITRNCIAAMTAQLGDAQGALRLWRELLPDQENFLGKNHPNTLNTRYNIVAVTFEKSDAPEALQLFKALLTDQECVLGKAHPKTLLTRCNIAYRTLRAGDRKEALRLFKELLPDQERVLGKDHPMTVETRTQIDLAARFFFTG